MATPGSVGGPQLRQAHGPEVAVQVGDPKGAGKLAEVTQQPLPVRHSPELPGLLFGDAGEENVQEAEGSVDERYRAVASGGEGTGGVEHAL